MGQELNIAFLIRISWDHVTWTIITFTPLAGALPLVVFAMIRLKHRASESLAVPVALNYMATGMLIFSIRIRYHPKSN